MTKAQREKQEREMLKKIIDETPQYKRFLDALIERENNGEILELQDVLEPILEEKFIEHRTKGTLIGWVGCVNYIKEKIKDMKTAEEIKQYIEDYIIEIDTRITEGETI